MDTCLPIHGHYGAQRDGGGGRAATGGGGVQKGEEEYKREEKYKTEEETTLSRKISKINMHSIGKKSSRMSQKLLTSLGMDSMVILGQKIQIAIIR